MKAIIVALGLAVAPPVRQEQPDASTAAAEKAQEQRKRAIRCKENRGADCESDVGLAEWLLRRLARRGRG